MRVVLMSAMVEDGAVSELTVGDAWSVALMFQPREYLISASDAELGLWPEVPLDSDPTPLYHLTARVRRRVRDDPESEALGLETPVATFGLRPDAQVPAGTRVSARGSIRADPWMNMVWAVPATRRRCVVEGLEYVDVPARRDEEGRLREDWSRCTRRTIDLIDVRHDASREGRGFGFYVVHVALDPRAT